MAIIAGLPGAGKTTVLSKVVELAKREGLRLRVVNYGTLMLKTARAKKFVSNRDEIRRLPIETQEKLQLLASEEINRLGKGRGIIVVDTHMIINTPRGWWPGIPAKNLEKIAPSQIISIEASPKEILRRRGKDTSRLRDTEEISDVEKELLYSRNVAAACSVLTGCPVSVVINREGKIDEAVEEVLSVIRGMKNG